MNRKNERFTCPATGDVCAYFGYCSVQKVIREQGGPAPGTSMHTLISALPAEVIEATNSYCADEQLFALTALATSTKNEEIRKIAVTRSQQIVISESFFDGSGEAGLRPNEA